MYTALKGAGTGLVAGTELAVTVASVVPVTVIALVLLVGGLALMRFAKRRAVYA